MFNFISLVHALVIACFSLAGSGRVKRVVGGEEVPCGTIPRVASLQNSSTLQHLCGATIISPDYAITAAHCVHYDAQLYSIELRNYCADDNEMIPRGQVLEVVTNELYDRRTRGHDIAVLRISLDVDDFTWLEDSVLPTSSFGVSGDCTIYGYGSRYPGSVDSSEVLLAAEVRIVSLDECTRVLGPIAPEYNSGMMCAGGQGADSCQGDSGSPLMCGSWMEGVSSHGLSCGVPGVPGVYTSIGSHMSWIRDVVSR